MRGEGASSGPRREMAGQATLVNSAGKGSSADWGRTRGATHPEHAPHGYDSGGVEAQRLVERRRPADVLPRVEKRARKMRGELRAGWRQAAHAACAGEGTTAQTGGRAREVKRT